MPDIDIYKSSAWHEFIENKDHWLGTDPLIMIIPEPADKLHLAKAFSDLNPNALFTIPELIENYLKGLGEKGLISLHGLESILSSIITESFAPYLKIEKYKQGYVKALADFIFNFRKTANTDLQSALTDFKADQLTFKEKDLIKIYAEYERKLPDYGFDLKSGLAELIRNTTEKNSARHLGISDHARIVFFGFNFINPLEAEFIFTVFQNTTGVVFLLCEDPGASEPAVRVQKSSAELLKRSPGVTVEHQLPALNQANFFKTLANTVFNLDSGSNRPIAEPERKLFITKENNRFSEMVSIARRIKHLTENGVSLKDIRIVTPEYQLYSSIIREVFPEYGIPFSLENGVPLLRFPLAAVIFNLVNQSIHSNPYLLREKIFSSPYISFSTEVNPPDLAKYQQSTGVEFIPAERLKLFLQPARYRLDFRDTGNILMQAYRAVKPAPETHQLEVVKQYLDRLDWKDATEKQNTVFRCLIQFYLRSQAEKSLAAWQSRMSGAEFKEALLGIFTRFNIEENIKFSNHIGRNSREFGIRERDTAILKQINKLLDEMNSFLAPLSKSPAEKFALLELVRIFSRLMSEAALPSGASAGVSVQPADTGEYQKWEYSFICGLVDGEFPGTDEFNFLQPKKEGLSLGHAYTSVDHARNHFYHLIRSTVKTLFLSRPLSDNGRRLPVSPFIKEIEKCLPVEIDAAAESIHTSEQLYSPREKLFLIGKKVDYNYHQALPLLKEIKQDEALFKKITAIMRFDGLVLNSAKFSEFDGVFGSNPAAGTLLSKDLDKITFTAAIFERYAACPLRFFLDEIMGLKSEPDYHPDITEAGLLIRTILKEYTTKAAETKGIPDEAGLLIRELISRHYNDQYRSAEDAFQVRFKNQLLAGLGQPEARRPGLFYAFLEYEKKAPDLIRPYSGNLSGTIKLGDELEIRVEIDRIDLTQSSDNFILYLYTTASTGNPGKILTGLRFDLPLAILWFSGYTEERRLKIPVAGAGLYLVKNLKEIKRGGYFAKSSIKASRQSNVSEKHPIFSGQREGFIEDEDFAPALEKIKNHILRLYKLMKKGIFHLPLCDEAEQSCLNCSFDRVCRKDQLRLERLRYNLKDDEDINVVREII
jgi:ATP-dependent helicase/DNAse subunit B